MIAGTYLGIHLAPRGDNLRERGASVVCQTGVVGGAAVAGLVATVIMLGMCGMRVQFI